MHSLCMCGIQLWLLTGMGAGFYLSDSGSTLEGLGPGQVYLVSRSILPCGSAEPARLLCMGVEGLEPGKSLVLLRKGIRCPEIIKVLPCQGPGRKQSEVDLSEASVSSEPPALEQELLLGYLSCLILFFFWSI